MTDAGIETAQGSPFWRFSLGFYRQPGVADACITLQDECGVDVNVLMFFLWFATQQKEVSPDQARAVWEHAALWRDHVVAPLRGVRRKLKEGVPLVARDTAEFFRTRIKAMELESERLEQEALYAMIPSIETVDVLVQVGVAALGHQVVPAPRWAKLTSAAIRISSGPGAKATASACS